LRLREHRRGQRLRGGAVGGARGGRALGRAGSTALPQRVGVLMSRPRGSVAPRHLEVEARASSTRTATDFDDEVERR